MIKLPIHQHYCYQAIPIRSCSLIVTQPDRTKLYYTLYPKQEDSAFQSMTISFGANKAPNLMILQDSFRSNDLCTIQ